MELVTEKPTKKAVPKGYKQTDAGMIPEDWDVKKMSEIGTFAKGKGIRKSDVIEQGLPCIRYGEIYTKHHEYIKSFHSYISAKVASKVKKLNTGDILFAGSGETKEEIGKCVAFLNEFEAYAGGDIVLLSPFKADSKFLGFQLNSIRVNQQKAKRGQGDAVVHIYSSGLSEIKIPLPPTVDEQRTIAGALSDVDALIAELDALIEKKQQIKKGAMQQLLTGKKRLPGFDGEWEEVELGDLLNYEQPPKYIVNSEIKDESVGVPVLTANKSFILGYTPEKEGIFEDIPIILFDDFTTLSKFVDFKFKVKSSAIKILKPKNNSVNLRFIYELMQVLEFSTGDHKRYYISEYQHQIIKIPSIKEQKAIARILSDMDAEIQSLQAKRDKYQEIKQGMMQELLTGKTRLVGTQVDQSETKDQKKSGHNWQIDEAVLISVLADRFGSKEYPIGRFRRTKLSYLVRRFLASNVDQFLKKAAGPYNHNTRYSGPEKIALDNGYVQEWENGKYSGFIADENIAEAQEYFEGWHGLDALDWLDNGFRYKKNEDLELLTTVDKSIVELREEDKEVSLENVKDVIASHPEWEEKLERDLFSDENIEGAIKQSIRLFK